MVKFYQATFKLEAKGQRKIAWILKKISTFYVTIVNFADKSQ